MMEPGEIPEELIGQTVRKICSHYRIIPDAAERVLLKQLHSSRRLNERLKMIRGGEDIARLHEFKEAVISARREIYHNLRRYHRDRQAEADLIERLRISISSRSDVKEIKHIRDDLLMMHSSTAERFDSYPMMYQELFRMISPPETILDIACGLHPLSYPFEKHKPVDYTAIEKDALCIDALNVYTSYQSANSLRAINQDISTINWSGIVTDNNPEYDFAFMLKLIPVLKRQDEESLKRLVSVPAKRILITGNEEALTRKKDVSIREDRALRDFIAISGKHIIDEFRIPGEFGYLVG